MLILKTVPRLSAVCRNQFIFRSCKPVVVVNKRFIKVSCERKRSSPLSDPENKGQQQTGINFDTLGSWNNRLSQQVNYEHSLRTGRLVPQITLSSVGQATLLGRRKKNEDRTSIVQINEDIMMFAIYDGHGGEAAVNFIRNRIPEHIQFWLERGEKDLGNVLKSAFKDCNTAFSTFLSDNYSDHNPQVSSGTTATVCLLRHGVQLVVGHVGDSLALVCREGNCLSLTREHRPEGKEKERIVQAGGCVTYDSLGSARVNGRLEMSRSLGDIELKAVGVTEEPEITSLQIKHGKDSFLVLTTDGVHYVLNSQEIVDSVCNFLTPDEAARFLTDQALHYGSEDNVTAVVVPFGAWGKYTNNKNLQFSFSRNVFSNRYS